MATRDEPILRAVKLNKSYPGVRALCDVDFELHAGEVRALLGKNGAGKSTLVKILSGASTPDSGAIYLDGAAVHMRSPADAFAAGIGTVYQEMSLVRGLTVAENILLGRWPYHKRLGFSVVDRRELFRRAREALSMMGAHVDPGALVGRLSVPEQQIVEIAKAVSFHPKVLILDEPTSSLPEAEVDQLLRLVRQLAANGVAVIYVSHRLKEIPRVADSLTVLRDGALVGTIDIQEASPERIANMMIGGAWSKTAFEHHAIAPEVSLSVRNLCRGAHLRDISFDLHAGEVLGIAGLLGSGRTELLRAIFGLDRLDSGTIAVDGKPVADPDPMKMKARGIGLTPEDRKGQGLVLVLGVDDNLTMSCMERIATNQVISGSAKRKLASEMVKAMSISTPSLNTITRSLSGGNQQKVVIGKWLNSQVKILLMDEPTRGIDIHAKDQVYSLVRDLAARGISVIFVSSELDEVLNVADRILVLNQGRMIAEIPAAQADLEQVLALSMKEQVNQ